MKKRRLMAIAIMLMMMVTMLAPLQVSAASGDGPLVKSVTSYYWNNNEKKWIKSNTEAFKYENKYPTEFKTTYYQSENVSTTTAKYKFKKGVPKSGKHISEIGRKDQTWKYKNGRRVKSVYNSNPIFTSKDKNTSVFTYNKSGFVTNYKYTWKETWYKGSDKGGYGYKYKYTMKKGLPVTMEARYVDSKGKVETSYYYLVNYNKKGLITKVSRVDSEGKKTVDASAKYTFKKGKLVKAITYYYNGGKKTPDSKFIFKSTSTKVNKKRYANMINDMVFYNASYGKYIWY